MNATQRLSAKSWAFSVLLNLTLLTFLILFLAATAIERPEDLLSGVFKEKCANTHNGEAEFPEIVENVFPFLFCFFLDGVIMFLDPAVCTSRNPQSAGEAWKKGVMPDARGRSHHLAESVLTE